MVFKLVYLETFGCQMNILDSQIIMKNLSCSGYRIVNSVNEADIVLYNSCSVRELSEQKIYSRLGALKLRKYNLKPLIIGLLGCMAERVGVSIFQKNPEINLLIGPGRLGSLVNLLQLIKNPLIDRQVSLSGFGDKKKYKEAKIADNLESFDALRSTQNQTTRQAYIRVSSGCNRSCSFCIVPKTRGPEVYKSKQFILKEIQSLVDSGVLEITLLGQTINHYPDFAGLLKQINDENPKLKRLRFITSHPKDFDEKILNVIAGSERICNYLHIPAQSGSNSVLQNMNRGYTGEQYLDLIQKVRIKIPKVSIVGDIIVGFPGETDEDFEATVNLIRKVRFHNLFVFKYSPRPGTASERFKKDNVPLSVKKLRNNIILACQRDIALSEHKKYIGSVVDVLVISNYKNCDLLSARTEGDQVVLFNGSNDLIGTLARVLITGASHSVLFGVFEGRII